jgi:hypothetical protein
MSGAPMIIQPIIVEKPVPIPIESNKTIMFPVPIALNNNNMTKLSR